MSSAFKRKSFYPAFLISIAAFATLVQAQDKGLKKIHLGADIDILVPMDSLDRQRCEAL